MLRVFGFTPQRSGEHGYRRERKKRLSGNGIELARSKKKVPRPYLCVFVVLVLEERALTQGMAENIPHWNAITQEPSKTKPNQTKPISLVVCIALRALCAGVGPFFHSLRFSSSSGSCKVVDEDEDGDEDAGALVWLGPESSSDESSDKEHKEASDMRSTSAIEDRRLFRL
jgi:hypothetical protein